MDSLLGLFFFYVEEHYVDIIHSRFESSTIKLVEANKPVSWWAVFPVLDSLAGKELGS